MDALLSRYRNLSILLVVVVAQLLFLAYQVKTKNRDERLLRVWAVTTVTPVAGIVEAVRRNTIGFLEDYFILLDVREQNLKLQTDNSRLKMENVYYRNQLATAERARTLSVFQTKTPSRTVAARVTGNSTVSTARAVYIDRGSTSAVQNGMAVVTPDGIVGKVIAVYPLASQVLLVNDPTFAVGIESQKNKVHGILQCDGGRCLVNAIQNEERIDSGEMFFTSGEDRIFPKGFPVGRVSSVRAGILMKEVNLELTGSPGGAGEVLVVLEGVHQEIPEIAVARNDAKMLPEPPKESKTEQRSQVQTEADRIRNRYQAIGKSENHAFGAIGSNVPNFNAKPPEDDDGAKKPVKDERPSQAVTEPKKTPAPTEPLGSRPGTAVAQPPKSQPSKPAAVQPKPRPTPVYPLGSPRPKQTPSAVNPQP